jgi:hypothetical protein
MKKIFYVLEHNGHLSADPKDESGDSELLFKHLQPDEEKFILTKNSIRFMAEAHGWEVKIRKATKEDLEEEEF